MKGIWGRGILWNCLLETGRSSSWKVARQRMSFVVVYFLLITVIAMSIEPSCRLRRRLVDLSMMNSSE